MLCAISCTGDGAREGDVAGNQPAPVISSIPAAAPTAADTATIGVSKPELAVPEDLRELPSAPESEPIRFDRAGHPILPIVLRGACEGESCAGSFVAHSCMATALRATPSAEAPIVLRLAAGEFVQVRRDLHVRAAGVVVVQRDFPLTRDDAEDDVVPRSDTVKFARGDTVFVLHYMELGRWAWSHRGRLYDSGEFWSAAPDQDLGSKMGSSADAKALSTPKREDWWKVTRRNGSSGWWLREDYDEALQSVEYMQKWGDDCTQARARAARG